MSASLVFVLLVMSASAITKGGASSNGNNHREKRAIPKLALLAPLAFKGKLRKNLFYGVVIRGRNTYICYKYCLCMEFLLEQLPLRG